MSAGSGLPGEERLVRVLILEDHPIVGQGVADALDAAGGFETLGVAGSVAEAEALLRGSRPDARPDVILADIDLEGESALDLPRRLGASGPPVLFLSALDGPAVLRDAIQGGAAGFVHKRESRQALFDAIRRVAGGQGAFSINDIHQARSAPREPSAREREVVYVARAGGFMVTVTSRILQRAGLTVRGAESAGELLDLAIRLGERPDLLIADAQLAGTRGAELADRLLGLSPDMACSSWPSTSLPTCGPAGAGPWRSRCLPTSWSLPRGASWTRAVCGGRHDDRR